MRVGVGVRVRVRIKIKINININIKIKIWVRVWVGIMARLLLFLRFIFTIINLLSCSAIDTHGGNRDVIKNTL